MFHFSFFLKLLFIFYIYIYLYTQLISSAQIFKHKLNITSCHFSSFTFSYSHCFQIYIAMFNAYYIVIQILKYMTYTQSRKKVFKSQFLIIEVSQDYVKYFSLHLKNSLILICYCHVISFLKFLILLFSCFSFFKQSNVFHKFSNICHIEYLDSGSMFSRFIYLSILCQIIYQCISNYWL